MGGEGLPYWSSAWYISGRLSFIIYLTFSFIKFVILLLALVHSHCLHLIASKYGSVHKQNKFF